MAPGREAETETAAGECGQGEDKYTWYRPNSDFNKYLSDNGIFTDVYREDDHFRWLYSVGHNARVRAARKLNDWCHARPAKFRRFICHSAGCNVVNIAMRSWGLRADELILLSPPVPKRDSDLLPLYLPKIENIAEPHCFFTVYPEKDNIIQSRWRQHYCETEVGEHQALKMLAKPCDHWSTVKACRWQEDKIPEFLAAGCDVP